MVRRLSGRDPVSQADEATAFWATLAPFLFRDCKSWSRGDSEADAIAEWLPHGAAVLDCGCGPGRHALPLARRGFRVTGVDWVASALDEARGRAAAEQIPIELVRQDMRRFRRPGAFDAALSLSTSFGLFEDIRDDERVAANLYESLGAKGVLLMDMRSRDAVSGTFIDRATYGAGSISLSVVRTVRGEWEWIDEVWTVIAGDAVSRFHFGYRPYTAAQLSGVLSRAGFREMRTEHALIPDNRAPERLVIRACK